MDTKREPTHVLRVEIPLHLEKGRPATGDFDPVQDAMLTALCIGRAAYLGAVCDGAQVSIADWPRAVALPDEPDSLRRAALWVVDNWRVGASQGLSMKALRSALLSDTEGGESDAR